MFTVTLWSGFKKRKNSTKRPKLDGTDSDSIVFLNGEIKGDFSPLHFTLSFDLPDNAEVPPYNYAYIEKFSRYYFITDWYFIGGLWAASFTVDVLATYREDIRGSHQYITRAAQSGGGDLMDTAYPTTAAATRRYTRVNPATFWGNSLNAGCIVAGIVGNSGNNIGAVTYYAMEWDTFNSFMSAMLSSINWAGISTDEISQQLQKALINPTQYIVSCVWIPVSMSQLSGVYTSTIRLGWWSFSVDSAIALNRPQQTVQKSIVIDLPKHPQAAQRGKYLNLSPYSSYTLTFLPFGVFQLDTTDLVDIEKLFVHVTLSPVTGDAVMRIANGESGTTTDAILTSQCNVGVQIPTGQVSANLSNFDNALLVGGVAGASDLVNAFNNWANRQRPGVVGGGGQTAQGLGGGRP